MKKIKNLKKRKEPLGGNHYYYTDSKGEKWSVVDIRSNESDR